MARHTDRRGFTLVEAVIATVIIAVILAITIPWLRERERVRLQAICTYNLKQLGLTIKMYSNASPGGIIPSPDGLKFLREDIYPQHTNDPALLMCPTDFKTPDAGTPEADKPQWYFDNSSYWYIAHRVRNEEEGQAYIEAYRKIIEDGDGNLDTDFVAPSLPTGKIERMSGDIRRAGFVVISSPAAEAAALADADSPRRTPVLIEYTDKHGPDGGNVLFMDGHVEFIKYPGKFPMTKAFIEGLKSLEKLDGSR